MIPAKPKIVTTESEFMNSQIPQGPIPFLWSIYLFHLEFVLFSHYFPKRAIYLDLTIDALPLSAVSRADTLLLVALIGPDTLCGLWIVCVMMAPGSDGWCW